jgi:hypothetical protein
MTDHFPSFLQIEHIYMTRSLSCLVTPNTHIQGRSLSRLDTPNTHIHGRLLSWLVIPNTHIHDHSLSWLDTVYVCYV